MFLLPIRKLFRNHSICVTGMKGCGKDLLIGNVIARENKPYISNMNYTQDDKFIPLDMYKLELNGNTFDNLVRGSVRKYIYPYPMGADIYISDVGIYFPSQYCNELNRKYPTFPFYFALSRQLSDSKVHANVQNLNRAWDKLREHFDYYITCNWCRVIGGFVIQQITIYDKYESCLNRVKPCRVSGNFSLNAQANATVNTYLDNFYNTHGNVKSRIIIYRNKSKHDTIYFKKLFEEGY